MSSSTRSRDARPGSVGLDREDERLREDVGVAGRVRGVVERVRGGDLGTLPVIAGLLIIAVVLQSLNPVFLSSANLVNLLLECVPVGVIALGVVAVLLVGQIDLSVGSISGLASASFAVLFVRNDVAVGLAMLAAVAIGLGIGLFYTFVFNRFGIPSFVISLAGLLGFLGLQLYLLEGVGSINIPFDSRLVFFAQRAFVPAWLSYVLVVLAAVAVLVVGLLRARRRAAASLSAPAAGVVLVQAALVLVGLGSAVWYLNRARGIGWMFVLFVGLVLAVHYVLSSTAFGRSLYAVGGNVEAARRAGIDVDRVYLAAFTACTTLAAVGGILAAARLASASQSSGGGDVNLNAIAAAVIGGTSLFGGRGSAFAALLGILVIQSITSGLTLLNLDSSIRFMVTGAVLLLAVGVDSVARSSRRSKGRG